MEETRKDAPGGNCPEPLWVQAFLSALSLTGNVAAACRAVDIERKMVYRLRDASAAFAEDWRLALENAGELLELEARRRAYQGVDEPIVHQGQIQGQWVNPDGSPSNAYTPGARLIPVTVKKYSDTLLIFLLKGALPQKYRERLSAEVSGPGGAPMESKVTHDVGGDLQPYADALGQLLSGSLGRPTDAGLSPDDPAKPVAAPPPDGSASGLPADPVP